MRSQVRREFEELVRELDMQLKRVKGQFAEYRESLHTDMKGSIHIIRKEALLKLVRLHSSVPTNDCLWRQTHSASAPLELKRVTEKMASSEDAIADLTTVWVWFGFGAPNWCWGRVRGARFCGG